MDIKMDISEQPNRKIILILGAAPVGSALSRKLMEDAAEDMRANPPAWMEAANQKIDEFALAYLEAGAVDIRSARPCPKPGGIPDLPRSVECSFEGNFSMPIPEGWRRALLDTAFALAEDAVDNLQRIAGETPWQSDGGRGAYPVKIEFPMPERAPEVKDFPRETFRGYMKNQRRRRWN